MSGMRCLGRLRGRRHAHASEFPTNPKLLDAARRVANGARGASAVDVLAEFVVSDLLVETRDDGYVTVGIDDKPWRWFSLTRRRCTTDSPRRPVSTGTGHPPSCLRCLLKRASTAPS